jgi:hypothetical protein
VGVVPDLDRLGLERREPLPDADAQRLSARHHFVPLSSTFSSM